DAVGQGQTEAAHDGFLGVAERDGRLVGDLTRETLGGAHQFRYGDYALHETDAERFGGRHAHAGEDHLEGLTTSHQTWQALGTSAARDEGEVDLGQAELRVLGRDPDIAGQGELEAAAEGEAADGGDDGLRATLHLRAEVEPLARLAEVRRG